MISSNFANSVNRTNQFSKEKKFSMFDENQTQKHYTAVLADTCPVLNPSGVTVSYNRAADSNGHYSLHTKASLSCAE